MSQLKNNQVIIIAPNSVAIKSVHKNHFEYDESKINNPAIKKIVTYVAAIINNEIENDYGVIVDYEYVIFGTGNTFDKAGVVFFLDKSLDKDTDQKIIQKARKLALFSIQELLPNNDIFHQKAQVPWLSKEKLQALEDRRDTFLMKWGNAKIHDGFSLIDSYESEPLLCVNTDFITPDKRDTDSGAIEGIGYPDGFSQSRHEVTLLIVQDSLQINGDIRKFTVAHPEILKKFVEACYKEQTIRFKATKTTDTASQKSSYQLDTMEVDNTLTDADQFTLTHESNDMPTT